MLERQAAWRGGILFGSQGGEAIAAVVVVGEWESRWGCGISKRSGKPGFGFPRNGFSTTVRPSATCSSSENRQRI